MTAIPECDPEVFENGVHVFSADGIRAARIEELVKMIAEKSGQKVDWHYVAGVACIRVVGDAQLACGTIALFWPKDEGQYRFVMDWDSPVVCYSQIDIDSEEDINYN